MKKSVLTLLLIMILSLSMAIVSSCGVKGNSGSRPSSDNSESTTDSIESDESQNSDEQSESKSEEESKTTSETESKITDLGSRGLTYSVNDDGISCTISGIGSCTDFDIRIPAETEGSYIVTAIDPCAFV